MSVLRFEFSNHDCQTARYAGLAGVKNGRPLQAAEAAGFDVLITVDQSLPHQQNVINRRIAILVLCSSTNRLEHLKQTISAALAALAVIQPGKVVTVSV